MPSLIPAILRCFTVLRFTYLLGDCIISMSSSRPVSILMILTGLEDDMEIM